MIDPAKMFSGLSAFPLTPADCEGVVDVDAYGVLLDRLCRAQMGSIAILGSTGVYAYLDRSERRRAVRAAVECVAGRVPLIVGVGALRTSWAEELARDAERAGADGLLLAPMSYTPLTPEEVYEHYRSVAEATRLPLLVYNNPTTTGFDFDLHLLGRLSAVRGVCAVKMPLPSETGIAEQIRRLRECTPAAFRIGYSGESGLATSLLAGADAFFSGFAGVLPQPMLRLAETARAGFVEEAEKLDEVLKPLWALSRKHGALRVIYAVAHSLGFKVGDPPSPIRRLNGRVAEQVAAALAALDHIP